MTAQERHTALDLVMAAYIQAHGLVLSRPVRVLVEFADTLRGLPEWAATVAAFDDLVAHACEYTVGDLMEWSYDQMMQARSVN